MPLNFKFKFFNFFTVGFLMFYLKQESPKLRRDFLSHWILLNIIEYYWILLNIIIIEYYWILLNIIEYYWILLLLNIIEYYWILLNIIEYYYYWILLNIIEYYWILLNIIEYYYYWILFKRYICIGQQGRIQGLEKERVTYNKNVGAHFQKSEKKR